MSILFADDDSFLAGISPQPKRIFLLYHKTKCLSIPQLGGFFQPAGCVHAKSIDFVPAAWYNKRRCRQMSALRRDSVPAVRTALSFLRRKIKGLKKTQSSIHADAALFLLTKYFRGVRIKKNISESVLSFCGNPVLMYEGEHEGRCSHDRSGDYLAI